MCHNLIIKHACHANKLKINLNCIVLTFIKVCIKSFDLNRFYGETCCGSMNNSKSKIIGSVNVAEWSPC